jgi:hypothetical protein
MYRFKWLAHAVATAAMAGNHLWQELGLPSWRELSLLMQIHFSSLKELNAGDMKWKKIPLSPTVRASRADHMPLTELRGLQRLRALLWA